MSEPDFVCQTAEPMSRDEESAWIQRSALDAESQGATFHQCSWHPQGNLILVESWKVRPDGRCPLPHFQFAAQEAEA